MDKTESETKKLNPDQESSTPNVVQGYGAVSTGDIPVPPPYGPSSTGYATTVGGHPYAPYSPYHQGYSPLSSQGDSLGRYGVLPSTQTTVILAPAQEPDYLGFSIFTMLCCCLPLGIAAFIYSLRTQESNQRGDVFTAHKNSRQARMLNYLALGFGICALIISIIVVVVVVSQQSPYRPHP